MWVPHEKKKKDRGERRGKREGGGEEGGVKRGHYIRRVENRWERKERAQNAPEVERPAQAAQSGEARPRALREDGSAGWKVGRE